MNVTTSPNPIYTSLRGSRGGFVDKDAFNTALTRARACYPHLGGRLLFNKVREQYWIERANSARDGEFNAYNKQRMINGKPPIGPDGAPMELDHRLEFHLDSERAFDPENLWELFRREHDFQHGNYRFRWSMKKLPRSPHDAELPTHWGDPLSHQLWP